MLKDRIIVLQKECDDCKNENCLLKDVQIKKDGDYVAQNNDKNI